MKNETPLERGTRIHRELAEYLHAGEAPRGPCACTHPPRTTTSQVTVVLTVEHDVYNTNVASAMQRIIDEALLDDCDEVAPGVRVTGAQVGTVVFAGRRTP